MKIEKLELLNFMGLDGQTEFNLPHITAMIGKNGIGKTTILNAIRYALTGAEPEGNIIHKNADTCSVSLTLVDQVDNQPYEFTRTKDKNKPSKFKINGSSTTQKAMNEKIEDVVGIPLEKIRLLSSSEVIASMKPQEFTSFILDYIPEKLKLDNVISLLPESTLGVIQIMEANLPEEDISLDILDEFTEMCKTNRKELKNLLTQKKAVYETLPKTKPKRQLQDVEKDLAGLISIEATYKTYLEKDSAYKKAEEDLKRQEVLIKNLRKEAIAIDVERPNPETLELLQKQRKEIQESVQNLKVTGNGANIAIKQLKTTLDTLSKPICPISPKIMCNQDKTSLKQEVEESIIASREGLEALHKEYEKSKANLAEVEAQIEIQIKNQNLFIKKEQILKQIQMMEENKVKLPEKPEAVEKQDVAQKKQEYDAELKEIKGYFDGIELQKKISSLETEYVDYDYLCKATSDKGVIRTAIISTYMKVFEDLCNERSSKVRPEISFHFELKDGIVVLMDNGKGIKLPYTSLSGGERAYMIFIIMDMLNSLTGINLLMMDELSVIDNQSFGSLLDIVTMYAEGYDHVFLAAVDHPDTVENVKKHGIPILNLES